MWKSQVVSLNSTFERELSFISVGRVLKMLKKCNCDKKEKLLKYSGIFFSVSFSVKNLEKTYIALLRESGKKPKVEKNRGYFFVHTSNSNKSRLMQSKGIKYELLNKTFYEFQ